jgi:hypothetical protein
MEPFDAKMAEIMLQLAEADKNRNKYTAGWNGGKGYRDYWDTLDGLLNGRKATLEDLQQACGDGVPLAVCNEVASALYRQLSDFKAQGVTRGEMESALSLARTFVEKTFCEKNENGRLTIRPDLNENMKNRAESALKIIGDAEDSVRRAFGGRSRNNGSLSQQHGVFSAGIQDLLCHCCNRLYDGTGPVFHL